MVLSPRISIKALAELSHRLAVETEAGIDIRRTWQREAESAHAHARQEFVHVRDAVAGGESLSVALAGTGGLFPPLFLEMVDVGEQTGTLGQVFHRLANHYRRQQQLKRLFLATLTWPMLQLAAVLLVIGILIWILGIIAQRNQGQVIDILGFGLVGTRGLVIYVNLLIAVGLCAAGLIVAVRRGLFWTRPIKRAVMRIPGIGSCWEKLALARLTWALYLTMNVEMDLRRVVPLALRATGNDHYIRNTDAAVSLVAAGRPLHEALDATGAFPADFIDALAVAEESGQIVESMDRLSRRYEEEAESELQTLTTIVGFAVWTLVAVLIIFMIFRLASLYFGMIENALAM